MADLKRAREDAVSPAAAPRQRLPREHVLRTRVALFTGTVAAHRRGSAHPDMARELHDRIALFIGLLGRELKRQYRLREFPLEVHEYDSFTHMVSQKPRTCDKWHGVILLAHGSMAAYGRADVSGAFPQTYALHLGDGQYSAAGGTGTKIEEAIAEHGGLFDFHEYFVPESELDIFACGSGAQSADAVEFMRDVYGIDGKGRITGDAIDFRADGRVGIVTGTDPATNLPTLRDLTERDWIVVPPRG